MDIFSAKAKKKHQLVIEHPNVGWTKLWMNYALSIPMELRPGSMERNLRNNWKCLMVPANGHPTYLQFESEEDRTAFVLRWS